MWSIRTGGAQQIGNQFRRNGDAWPVLAVLPCVTVVRHYSRNPACRCALQRIDHNQQLHQVLVHRAAGGLDQKHIHAAHVLEQLKVNLAIGKPLQLGFAQRHADELADLLRERTVGRSAENLEALVFTQPGRTLPLRSRFCSLGSSLWRSICRRLWRRLRILFWLLSLT